MSDPLTSFNAVVNNLNEASYKFGVYRSDWALLPAGVKTAIKNAAIATITQARTDLLAVQTEITNLV